MIQISFNSNDGKLLSSTDERAEIERKGTGYEWVVLSVTTVGALIASIQESALLISLPNMMSSLNMSFLTVMWVLLTYLLITTVMVPIFGRMSDMFGRKRLMFLAMECSLSAPC